MAASVDQFVIDLILSDGFSKTYSAFNQDAEAALARIKALDAALNNLNARGNAINPLTGKWTSAQDLQILRTSQEMVLQQTANYMRQMKGMGKELDDIEGRLFNGKVTGARTVRMLTGFLPPEMSGALSTIEGLTGGLEGMGTAALGLAAGATVLAGMGAAMVKLGNEGQQVLMAEKRLAAFTGSSGRAVDAMHEIQRASEGSIDAMTGMTLAAQLLSMGVAQTPEDVGQIVRLATMLGSPMRTAEDKIKDFTMLLANQSIRRLDQFGISVADVRQRQKELVETTAGLSKEQAFTNAVLEIGSVALKKLEGAGVGAATSAQKLGGAWANLRQSLGKDLAGPVSGIEDFFARTLNYWAGDKRTDMQKGNDSVRDRIVQMAQERDAYIEAYRWSAAPDAQTRDFANDPFVAGLNQQIEALSRWYNQMQAAQEASRNLGSAQDALKAQVTALAEAWKMPAEDIQALTRYMSQDVIGALSNPEGGLPASMAERLKNRSLKDALSGIEADARMPELASWGPAIADSVTQVSVLAGRLGISRKEAQDLLNRATMLRDMFAASAAAANTIRLNTAIDQLQSMADKLDFAPIPQGKSNLPDVPALQKWFDQNVRSNSDIDLKLKVEGEEQLQRMADHIDAVLTDARNMEMYLGRGAGFKFLAEQAFGAGTSIEYLAEHFSDLPERVQRTINPTNLLAAAIRELRAASTQPVTIEVKTKGIADALKDVQSTATDLATKFSMSPDMAARLEQKWADAAAKLKDFSGTPLEFAVELQRLAQEGKQAQAALSGLQGILDDFTGIQEPPKSKTNLPDMAALNAWFQNNVKNRADIPVEVKVTGEQQLASLSVHMQDVMTNVRKLEQTRGPVAALQYLADTAFGAGTSLTFLAEHFDELPSAAQAGVDPVRLLTAAIRELRAEATQPITIGVKAQGIADAIKDAQSAATDLVTKFNVSPDLAAGMEQRWLDAAERLKNFEGTPLEFAAALHKLAQEGENAKDVLGQLAGVKDKLDKSLQVPEMQTNLPDMQVLNDWFQNNVKWRIDIPFEVKVAGQEELANLDARLQDVLAHTRNLEQTRGSAAALKFLAEEAFGAGTTVQYMAEHLDEMPGPARAMALAMGVLAAAINETKAAAAGGITVEVRATGIESTKAQLRSIAIGLLQNGVSPEQAKGYYNQWANKADMTGQNFSGDSFDFEAAMAGITNGAQALSQSLAEAPQRAKQAAEEFRSQVKQAATDLRSRITDALNAGNSVSAYDMALTKLGQYQDKPMENARRLDAIGERGKEELIKHPDWAGILGIPPEVLSANDDILKAWALKTAEDVRNYLRPDLINWDAFIEQFQTQADQAAQKEATIMEAVKRLDEAGKLKGLTLGQKKDEVEAYLFPRMGDLGTQLSQDTAAAVPGAVATAGVGKAFGTALADDFKVNAKVFADAGSALGGSIVTAVAQGVRDNIGAVRYEIAAGVAPEVAKILKVKSGSGGSLP